MERTENLQKGITENLTCFHCGDNCPDDSISINDKYFCCNGCKTVYEIFESNNLCKYYQYDKQPGIKRENSITRNYEFLDDPDLKNKLTDFSNGKISTTTLTIPQMHCSSCIWILENLTKLDGGVISSQVNFLQKKIFIRFSEEQTSIRKIVELLDSIGYEPLLNLEEKTEEKNKSANKSLYYKIGIAGFCFGNIMLLSFPEYLSIHLAEQEDLRLLFSYLNILLSLPVFFYSASEYFVSAWKGLKKKIVNIDVPVALGISVLFIRSLIEIVVYSNAGYLDSMAGLVFFLLIGRLFQNKTYETLNFERDYKSYFPISVTVKKNNIETTIPVEKLTVGDRIVLKNGELLPADSILFNGTANIDYSFVTGESAPVELNSGDMIYAGGKQLGRAIELETIKEVSQSYLTRLWNNQAFNNDSDKESKIESIANAASKYFTFIVLFIAASASLYWLPINSVLAFNAFTAVLIVACPCALALSTPFTLGNTLRIFGKNKFYLKNTHTIERLSAIDSIVFDKTGTITENGASEINYFGEKLSSNEVTAVRSTVRNSSHPLSIAIYNYYKEINSDQTDFYEETPGKGILSKIKGLEIKIGSINFVTEEKTKSGTDSSLVYLSINGLLKGYYKISNKYRVGLINLVSSLRKNYDLTLLSGDNEYEKNNLKKIFGNDPNMYFNQSPHDKLKYIYDLQQRNKNVLMIGDGLNDAGALKQSNIGISISDDINNFSPACDGILDSKKFSLLNLFIEFSKMSKKIIYASFTISIVYNLIGLYFAVKGTLSPVIAAILMPVSSISVVIFTTFTTTILAKRKNLL